jgi:XTP/dITP diphosphohydrolase
LKQDIPEKLKLNKIIFATKNEGKVREVVDIFSDTNFKIVSLTDFDNSIEIKESADTFEGNAKIKADTMFEKFKIAVIADDSGISVEQLGGRPGVFSARYAGENATDDDNNNKLISELEDYSEPHPAKYVCASVYFDGINFFTGYGEIKGKIINSPRGTNGFGYDPYFVPDGYTNTMAELSPEEKNSISHRAKAFNQLKEKIKNLKAKI